MEWRRSRNSVGIAVPGLVNICYSMKPAADISLMIFFAKLSAKTELVMFAKPDAEVLASMMKAL
jgi:hypothetical protein